MSEATHSVRIDSLVPADSPRLNGIDKAHVRRLAAVYESLPPLLVHRSTLRVVDGMHRLGAATLRGLDTVEVQFFDGSDDQVFLRSVTANIAHGLPLSVAERKTAAARLLHSHPTLSDRAVAGYVGLDAKTVASVRACSAAGSPPLNARTSADGRVHPLDRTAERMHAAELLTKDPQLSLRAVVRETGLSLGTAHDVRRRLQRGESPVPPSRRGTGPITARTGSVPRQPVAARTGAPPAVPQPSAAGAPQNSAPPSPNPLSPRARAPLETLRKLARDPSLRHSESGRELIRWIHVHFILDEAWRKRADAVPAHTAEAVAEIALHCSDSWRRFAEELSGRQHHEIPRAPSRSATQPTTRH